MTDLSTASLLAGAATRPGAAFSRQVATLAARRQIEAGREVAGLVAQSAAAPVPPGQGRVVDMRA
ncbi:hypothetical protein [Methylobacterium platani]|uniref:Motility protein n=2 Tax=Methylobacterium platani TaxID=427683 RepID=A0A179SGD3_9HYPH|nr:hypothetical protein [Methylobacterium platani]KMO16805.1 hypothetical protein SQ03_13840 [Methylobacterium platani JCM 14648]OAS26519.1 hypothetical protein A5481_05575 [Methylobacterium platani]